VILLQVLTRLLAFIGKELVEVVRRPGALLSLIVGPFVIIGLFGYGYNGIRQPLRAIVVVSPSSGLSTDPSTYRPLQQPGVTLLGVVPNEAQARQELLAGQADVAVVPPPDARSRFLTGHQSVIKVIYDMVDPIQASYASVAGQDISNAVNQEIIRQAVATGEGYAASQGVRDAAAIPPEVIAAPTRPSDLDISPTSPGVVPFYGPAVLALVLQHMALTLVALSLVKERTTGIAELFRLAPVTSLEVIVGKLLAFGILDGFIALLTVAVMVILVGVPMLASAGPIALVLGLLIAASTGLGLLIAVVSDSESQTVQLSLFVLLASVFFSGLILPVADFIQPVRALAYLLPVTNAIALLQSLMLQGHTNDWWQAAILAAIAGVSIVLSWLLLRRSLGKG
jgi:ABC-2 type transport system permease protein